MAGGIGHRAEDRDRDGDAIVRGGWRIKGPGRAELNDLVGAAAAIDHWRDRVDDDDRLAAGRAVAATIHGLPDTGGIEGVAAMAGGIGDGAQDGDRNRNAVVRGRGSIESPGRAKLDR